MNKDLTPAEKAVIFDKQTEPPFANKYHNFFEEGFYNCKNCGQRLFTSETKFDAGCGWPSFDEALPGSVKEIPDADGVRTEIVCAKCGGHLGHVFRGEKFTPKNTRMCVNSLSINFKK